MKRTFGKILSFALVLAMVLSMVPVVLAATTTGNPQYLALGVQELNIGFHPIQAPSA